MPTPFRIHPELFAAFPGLRVVTVWADGLDVAAARPAGRERWARAWAAAPARHAGLANAQSHPHVAAWRRALRGVGVSHKEAPASIEALLRRALKGGEPPAINPLVDLYNAVSLEQVVPAGGFDLDQLAGDLELRPTRAGDRFQALDAEAAEEVPPGEVAYASGGEVLTRHLVWKQSRRALLTRSTRRAVLVSEILGEQPDELAATVRHSLHSALAEVFGVSPRTTVLTAARDGCDLD